MLRTLIGWSMWLYRASPFCPSCGPLLARALSRFTRPRTSVLATIKGVHFDLDLREVIDSSLFYMGSFAPEAEKHFPPHIPPGSVVLDVGANIGCYTFTFAKLVGPTGLVVAVEPTDRAFAKLRNNVALNSFANIRCLQVGLSDRDVGDVDVSFQSSFPLNGRPPSSTQSVRLVTLDTLVSELRLDRVDFIKVDVDGYEAKVFAGARLVLERFRPSLFFELTPSWVCKNGDDPASLIDLLFSHGYSLRDQQGQSLPDTRSVLRRAERAENKWRTGINLLALPPTRIPAIMSL
jgi:FkbM family methyltransferase